jgi:outer membrane receptor protein involved in Fe transport
MMGRDQLLLAVAVSLGVGGIAQGAESAPSTESSGGLAEVVVTATKQSTTVQTTPISITAVTGEQIASRGQVDLGSLINSVPQIAVRNAGGPAEMEFEIRGLNSQGGNSSMVGLYFGEIPLSANMASLAGKISMNPGLYDLQRVEVLSGPQGTLYGSSSMGGTIRLIPTPPQLNGYAASAEEVISGTVSGGLNHQQNAMVNLPLGDTAAVRIVGSMISNSGWIDRLVIADGAVPVDPGTYPDVSRPSNFNTAPLRETLRDVNTSQVNSVRAQILWQPIENLTIEPMALYQSIRQDAPPTVDVNGNPTHPRVPAVWAHYEIYDAPEPQPDSLSFGSLTLVYQLPSISLTSATGFWRRDTIYFQDTTEQIASALGFPEYDASAGGIGPLYSSKGAGIFEQDISRQLSEEFRVASTGSGPLHWVAGYFYQHLYSEDDFSALAPEATQLLGGSNLSTTKVPENLFQNSIFANVSWRFSPHFEVAAGLRYYHYRLNVTGTEAGLFDPLGAEGLDVPYNFANSTSSTGTVPSFTLTYNIDSDHMVYTRIGKAFRLGGISTYPVPVASADNTNPLFAPAVANECALQAKVLLTTTCDRNILLQVPTTFKSDSLWSYELGEKSSFFQRHLIANLNVYLENWNSPQVATDIDGNGVTVNGGNARIKGVEGQLQALLPWGFDLAVNASYIDAKFVEGSAIAGYPAGMQIPDTPKVAGSVILQWKHDLDNGLALFGSLEDNYTGTRTDLPFGINGTLLTTAQLLAHLPAYNIANLRLGVRGERESGSRWNTTFFVNNFTNQHALLDPNPSIALQTAAYERYTLNQPLTAGIDVSYEWR